MADTNVYGVKIVYTYTVENDAFYEESVLRVRADSFDDAYARAEQYVNSNIEKEYRNADGKTVTVSYAAVDCFHVQEENDRVEEVFSAFSQAPATTPCTAETLRPLRHE
ncbi:MAG: DUF4288 domain-containing protein [Clostridia bacterium]|nr:DUF4288 domain-containing protein [Clostridia bacterium]